MASHDLIAHIIWIEILKWKTKVEIWQSDFGSSYKWNLTTKIAGGGGGLPKAGHR